MSAADLLRFAAGGLRGHRLRAGLTLLGVAIGVASVILLTSLGEGARRYITGEFASLGSNLLIVVPGKTETAGFAPLISTAANDLTLDDADALVTRVPSIRRVAPLVVGTAAAHAGVRSRQVTVVATTRAMLEVRHLKMGAGRFLPPEEPNALVCVLGARVARELFPGATPLGQQIRVGGTRFRVVGVIAPRGVSIGMDLDDVIEIPIGVGMRMFNRTSLFRILAEVASHAQIEAARQDALAVLRERHGQEDVTVLTQDSVLSTFDQILRALTAALGAIAAISLGVAGLGIMNVMLVSVSERTREIGLLRAVGVTRGQVVGIFLVEAALLATAGGVLGLLASNATGRLLRSWYPDFPLHTPEWGVPAALAVSCLVGVVFGLLPARRAALMDPVAALRGGRL